MLIHSGNNSAVLCLPANPLRSSRMRLWMSDRNFTQRVLNILYPGPCRSRTDGRLLCQRTGFSSGADGRLLRKGTMVGLEYWNCRLRNQGTSGHAGRWNGEGGKWKEGSITNDIAFVLPCNSLQFPLLLLKRLSTTTRGLSTTTRGLASNIRGLSTTTRGLFTNICALSTNARALSTNTRGCLAQNCVSGKQWWCALGVMKNKTWYLVFIVIVVTFEH